MNREGLQESLSAVMDNEADELELRRVLLASEDASLRSTWSRYQVARAAMHGELLDPKLDLASAVATALDGQLPVQKRRAFGVLGQVAVAATVTVAVLAGVRFYSGSAGDQLSPQMVGQEPAIVHSLQEPVLPASYSQDEQVTELKQVDKEKSPWLQATEPSSGDEQAK